MYSFVQVLGAVLLASVAESLPPGDPPGLDIALLAVLVGAAIPVLWGEGLRALARRGGGALWIRPLAALFPAAPLLVYGGVLFFGGWADLIRPAPLAQSQFLRFAALLAPYFLAYLSHAIEIRRLEAKSPLWRGLGLRIRMQLFALLPLGLYLAASDLFAQSRDLRVLFESLGIARFGATLLFLVALLLFLPLCVRPLWGATPLPPGALRQRLEGLAARFRFRFRDILVWRTEGATVNAAILGLFPRFRYVILTDGLIASLSPAEVESVFGHELGHAKKHHVAVFFSFAMGSLLLFLLLAENALPQDELGLGLAALPVFLGWWSLFGYASRRFELEADLYGAEAVGDPEIFIHALEKVGSFSGRGRWHGSWRHFSVADRVSFLRTTIFEPALGEKLKARLRAWSRACLLGFGATFLLYAGLLVRGSAIELAEFDLRRGLYASALGRLESVSEDSPEREEILRLAAEGSRMQREEPERWRDRLVSLGRERFLKRDFLRSSDLLTLAYLLDEGGTSTWLLARAASYLAEGDEEGLRRLLLGEGADLLRDPELAELFYRR